MRPAPIKLTEEDREPDENDFVIPVELPDGKRVQIAIPCWDKPHWGSFSYKKDSVYWLNFVTDDHYC